MLDKMMWKCFEKTGFISAYLLYSDIKNLSNIKEVNIDAVDNLDINVLTDF